MSIKDFFAHLKKGFKDPVYVLNADEHYVMKEALGHIRGTIPEGEQDFCLHVFDCEATADERATAGRVLDVLRTMPFMGARQVVAVENANKFSDKDMEVIGAYLEAPVRESVLFLLEVGRLKKSHEAGLKKARLISMNMRTQEFPAWLAQKAQKMGFALEPRAIEYLLATMGPDVGLLSAELKKLSMLGKADLTIEDVREAISGPGSDDAFKLIDAIRAGDERRAIGIYRRLSEGTEVYALLGAMCFSYAKGAARMANAAEVFELLGEADVMIRKSGGLYPMECLIMKLSRLGRT